VPSARRRIEEGLRAQCLDLYWSVELGPAGWQCPMLQDGLHLNEDAFIVEAIDPQTGDEAPHGTLGELVVTSLGRIGMPLVRYRSGDLVRLRPSGGCGCGLAVAEGGILGRHADLLTVRGVQVIPSSLENVVRRHPAVTDFRIERYDMRGHSELAIKLQPDAAIASEGDRARVAAEVAADIRRSLGVLLQCEAVPPGSLEDYADSGRRARMFRRQ
jgi:phenylacetate-CoA ligase